MAWKTKQRKWIPLYFIDTRLEKCQFVVVIQQQSQILSSILVKSVSNTIDNNVLLSLFSFKIDFMDILL